MRDNECYGDLAAWQRANAPDNEEELERLTRNLRLAREEMLTPRQRQLLHMYYEEGKNVTAIARELGIQKSSVSRTLARAKHQLYLCLRYGL
jgi:RNA polymerase sigma factor (sigma-70 family)